MGGLASQIWPISQPLIQRGFLYLLKAGSHVVPKQGGRAVAKIEVLALMVAERAGGNKHPAKDFESSMQGEQAPLV
jgi:hypothetical protein